MDEPLVSVVIPTYNRAEYLREAIESVLAQTYENFELLVLDNCSEDHTTEVVAGFKDNRIKYLRHQCNIGAEGNWGYGILWAQGEYLSILGDDDQYYPQFLSNRVSAISTSPKISSVFGSFDSWDSNKNILTTVRIDCFDESADDSILLSGLENVTAVLNGQFIGATLYRRHDLSEIWKKLPIRGKCFDELINALLAIEKGSSSVYLKTPGMRYTRHELQDSTNNGLQVAEEGVQMYEYLLTQDIDKAFKKIIENKLISHLNRNGRWLYETGNYNKALKFLANELAVNPFTLKSWLRLLRCYYAKTLK